MLFITLDTVHSCDTITLVFVEIYLVITDHFLALNMAERTETVVTNTHHHVSI